MTKADLRNLVLLWIAACLLAIVTAYISGPFSIIEANMNPAPEAPTTSWITAPATDIARDVHWLWSYTLLIMTPFLFGPLLILGYVIMRFSKSNNPTAAKFHEHITLEVAWTIIPALVLVAMALPAYGILKRIDYMPEEIEPEIVVDVVGAQFYWQYELPKYEVVHTDNGFTDEMGRAAEPLLLPHNKVIQMYGTSYQVNHAWWVPAFGIKYDVIPGRINQAWFVPEQLGSFKGQCAELCGALHAYMWIHVNIVSEKEFFEWLYEKGAKFPEEDRQKVIEYLGAEIAAEAYPSA